MAKKDSYDDYDVGFALAPRLNAVGRMGHARLAVEMFTRAGPEQAQQIASVSGKPVICPTNKRVYQ